MQPLSTAYLKNSFLQHYEEKGFRVLESFPMVSDDPTVMFVNATITPLKDSFLSSEDPQNSALIQRCFRMGGASELEVVGVDPYFHTFFEMFGMCMYRIDHIEAVREMMELLNLWEIEFDRLYFTIPEDLEFAQPLITNGVRKSHIFVLEDSRIFWQEWRFGQGGPIGRGLTAIYDRGDLLPKSTKQMAEDSDRFVKLLNLIHIYRYEELSGQSRAILNPGFDLGGGIERLAAIVQGCNNYQTDAIQPLVQLVSDFLNKKALNLNATSARILTDHLRSVCVLSSEGLSPSNKKHGYVLRKIIRRCLEIIWGSAKEAVDCSEVVIPFCEQLGFGGIRINSAVKIQESFRKESNVFLDSIRRAQRILEKNPNLNLAVLKDTYGLSTALASLPKERRMA